MALTQLIDICIAMWWDTYDEALVINIFQKGCIIIGCPFDRDLIVSYIHSSAITRVC
jgi:hypothetical protein